MSILSYRLLLSKLVKEFPIGSECWDMIWWYAHGNLIGACLKYRNKATTWVHSPGGSVPPLYDMIRELDRGLYLAYSGRTRIVTWPSYGQDGNIRMYRSYCRCSYERLYPKIGRQSGRLIKNDSMPDHFETEKEYELEITPALTECAIISENWDLLRRYPPFKHYERRYRPNARDDEGHRVYKVDLIRYNEDRKHCEVIIKAGDGKMYYTECRSWYLPDDEDNICLLRRSKCEGRQWTMNRYRFAYGSLSESSDEENDPN
jgi:hypothetical protein